MPDFNDTNPRDQRFRLAIEAALNAMVIVDSEGKIVLMNAQAEKLFGYPSEDVVGQPVEILLPESHRKGHDTSREGFFAHLQDRPMEVGRNVHARRKDGTQFPVEIGLSSIETTDGTWVLNSIVDIRERQRAEENFRVAIEASPNGMVLVNHEGKITLVNSQAENMFGYGKRELLGQPLEAVVIESSRNSPANVREGFSSQPSAPPAGIGTGLIGRRKDGSLISVGITRSPIETVEGSWVLNSIVDTTSSRQEPESVGVLATGIAHDFNNLLGSVLAETELAISRLEAGSQLMQEIYNMQRVVIAAAENFRELMIYAGQEKARLEPVDTSWLVSETVELLKASIPKNILLKTVLGNDLPPVLGDATQIRQVVMNLIINASEAIDAKGVIQVVTSQVRGGRNLAPNDLAELPEGDYVRLEVSDMGRGMKHKEQPWIVAPLVADKFLGRRLGRAAVQEIVHAHGGAINLVNATGLGTSFQILLPCAPGWLKNRDIGLAAARGPQIAGVGMTVLLVEDEDALRQPVAKLLRRSGVVVLEAADGSAAIETFRRQNATIDVILLDVTIPGPSSLEVLKDARRIRPGIKVILTSAYSQEMLPFPLDAPGVSGYIRKPFQVSELLHLIQEVLFVESGRSSAGS